MIFGARTPGAVQLVRFQSASAEGDVCTRLSSFVLFWHKGLTRNRNPPPQMAVLSSRAGVWKVHMVFFVLFFFNLGLTFPSERPGETQLGFFRFCSRFWWCTKQKPECSGSFLVREIPSPCLCPACFYFSNLNSAKKESEKEDKGKTSLFGEANSSSLWISFVTHIVAWFILLANLDH